MHTDKPAAESTTQVETVNTEFGQIPYEFCLEDVQPETLLGWWIANTCRAHRNPWDDAALLKLLTLSAAGPCDDGPTMWRIGYSEFGPVRLDNGPFIDDGNGGLRNMTDAELAELREALRPETEEETRMRKAHEASGGGVLDRAWADKRRRLRDFKRVNLAIRYWKQRANMRTERLAYREWVAKVTRE